SLPLSGLPSPRPWCSPGRLECGTANFGSHPPWSRPGRSSRSDCCTPRACPRCSAGCDLRACRRSAALASCSSQGLSLLLAVSVFVSSEFSQLHSVFAGHWRVGWLGLAVPAWLPFVVHGHGSATSWIAPGGP